ncbi:MAG: glycosyl hydrolase family 98, partial [Bacteroidales bacterium]|nr:glycosyl hydrolase family 98 [Bacteroidales bacterium]
RRNWAHFPNFDGVWVDMFRKVIDGTVRIPSREEVVNRTKIVVINDVNDGSDEDKYAAWGDLYDGLYKQDDPFNRGNGQWMDNYCYFKKTGRYATIPVCIDLYDDVAKSIPVQVKRSKRWANQSEKVAEFNAQYPEVATGDLFVARNGNQLVAYTPYSYVNKKTTALATIPL